jgi:7-carboxy-7-deazaguanine synthase
MRVNELFKSIQGEGVHAGIPTVFVRFQGCNIRCRWCDTAYAFDEGEELSVHDIYAKIKGLMSPYQKGWVCLTGGEPLVRVTEELVRWLHLGNAYELEVFTNGTIVPPKWFDMVQSWVVDAKCPSTGLFGVTKIADWVIKLRACDSLKFTVADEEDLMWTEDCLRIVREDVGAPSCTIMVSPVAEKGYWGLWDEKWLQRVAEFCIKHNFRYSLQVHKIVWGDKRGV